jgi:hypothetical protein
MEFKQKGEKLKTKETIETIFPDGLVMLTTETTGLTIWDSRLSSTNVTILDIQQKSAYLQQERHNT